jgi:chromosome segregation ATPase
MISLDDYQKLKRQIEQLRARKDKAEGRVEQLLKTLKEEFGCKTKAEAEERLERLKDEEQSALVRYNRYYTRFRKKYKNQLKDVE